MEMWLTSRSLSPIAIFPLLAAGRPSTNLYTWNPWVCVCVGGCGGWGVRGVRGVRGGDKRACKAVSEREEHTILRGVFCNKNSRRRIMYTHPYKASL